MLALRCFCIYKSAASVRIQLEHDFPGPHFDPTHKHAHEIALLVGAQKGIEVGEVTEGRGDDCCCNGALVHRGQVGPNLGQSSLEVLAPAREVGHMLVEERSRAGVR